MLQYFIDTAQSIEVSRPALVASTVSRNGRLITQTRNWHRPWQFTVEPRPLMPWNNFIRTQIENIFRSDRNVEHEMRLGNTSGSAWLSYYQGQLTQTQGESLTIQISEFVYTDDTWTQQALSQGTTLYLRVSNEVAALPAETRIFGSGDIIQPFDTDLENSLWQQYRYPYSVLETVRVSDITTFKNQEQVRVDSQVEILVVGLVWPTPPWLDTWDGSAWPSYSDLDYTYVEGQLEYTWHELQTVYVDRPCVAVKLNRALIEQTGWQHQGKSIAVGGNCVFFVKATSVPTMRLLPGQLVELTGNIELMESII